MRSPREGCTAKECGAYWDWDDVRKAVKIQQTMGVLPDEARLCKYCGRPTTRWTMTPEQERMNEDRNDETACARCQLKRKNGKSH